MEVEDSPAIDEPVAQSNQEATTSQDVDEETAPTTSGVEEGMEVAPQPSDLDVQGNEIQNQDEAVESSEVDGSQQGVETSEQGMVFVDFKPPKAHLSS